MQHDIGEAKCAHSLDCQQIRITRSSADKEDPSLSLLQ